MVVEDINKENFEEKVLKSEIPVVIDFWAEWCGPCRIFSPIIEKVSEDLKYKGKVRFYKLNTDENSEIAAAYGIMSIPTAAFFENGEVKSISVGAIPQETFKKWLDENLEI
ncbi:MAG: thioredoxin [Candidatus Micrarchaeia archaeon]|jgi:thioredoxin 1